MIKILSKYLIKEKFLYLFLCLSGGALAQSPALINYQGMLRDNKGLPVINQAIALRFEVLQGSDTGPVVYTDDQLTGVSTNSLGLFTTQIGKNSAIGQVNWEQGISYYLQVSVDPTGGSNLQVLGKAQQLLSVPYALHAQSVPASYANNVLSIGNKTFNITPTITATPNTSITSSGLGTVTSAGTNTFDINIPAPTFSNTGQTIITGTYPNYIVNTPTIPASVVPTIAVSNTAAATSTVLSVGSSFSINVPAPTFSNAGQNIITGTYPNFVVNTPTVPASAVPTIAITNTAAATSTVVSSGNSFSINMPPPTFNNSGQTLITGAYPNYTVNTPTVTAAPTLTATGLATVSAGPNYTVGVPLLTYTPASGALGSGTNIVVVAPTLSLSGNTLSSGPGTNSVLLPTNHTIVGQGIAAVTPSTGSIFTVTVNQPTFAYSNTTGSLTSGTSSANITPALTYSNSVITSGPSSNSISLGTGTNAVWSTLGNAGTSTLTNFIGTTDNVELNFRVNGNKSGTIDHILNNAYFGFQSGLSTTSASLNAGFGQEALKTISTANRNSAFGYQALKNSNGGSNTGIGASALTSNTSGSDNTALGKDALYINTTGSFNVGVGSGVFLNHLTGDNNVAIGRDAFNGNTSGANNVAVGSLAGYANVSGSGNVFIGYNAGYNETGSNKFILANTSTTTSPLLYGNFATNNLGIGTTSANAPLQFNQTISGRKIVLWEGANNDHQVYGFGLASNILRYQVDASVANHVFYSGINSSSSLELMRITGTGFVGIGTASPLAMLHVVNTNSVSDGISVDVNNVANGGNAAQIRHFGIGNAGYYEVNNTASNASAMFATSNSGTQYALTAINTNAALGAYAALMDGGLVTKGKNALNTAYALRAQNNTSSDLLVVRNDGYVGIGTNAPGTNLHVNSSNNFSQARFTHTASASFGLVLGTDNLSSVLLNYDNTPLYFGTNGANRMAISNTGNVNIGSFITSQKLNVDGNISLDDAAGTTSPARVIGFPVASTGNHGLLTLQAKSQVFSGTAFSGGNLLLAGGDYNVGSVNTSGSFGGNVTIQAGHNLWPHATGALIVFQAGTTSNTERMRIDGATGMVGIGTTAPDQLLTVNGNASKPGGGSWATFSDRRLKKDIHSFNDGLKELLKIEPVWYTYNGEASLPQDTFVGVIAQDLQSIAPYMVKETSRGIVGETNYLSVDNSAMTYMIINAIKEQQKLIEVLTQKIEDQKKEIDTLKKQ